MVCSISCDRAGGGRCRLSILLRLGLLGAAELDRLDSGGAVLDGADRFLLDPWQDPLGSGFPRSSSRCCDRPGRLAGAGLNRSMQKHFYLPEPQTDFIFAITAEELGWIGASLIIIIYLLIILEVSGSPRTPHDPFLCYVAVGIVSLFAIQVAINLGVVVGLFPGHRDHAALDVLRRQLVSDDHGLAGHLNEYRQG